MNDLFPEAPRSPRKILMHVVDAGDSGCHGGGDLVRLECKTCGHDSGWCSMSANGWTLTKTKRGIPCPECNK